jgi:FtsZ-interacting cell division protein ZipA
MILVLLIGLIAVTLLVFQLWAGRRDKAAGEEEREGAG